MPDVPAKQMPASMNAATVAASRSTSRPLRGAIVGAVALPLAWSMRKRWGEG